MKFKFSNVSLAGLLLSVSCLANAGLITDTANDSFIDTTTGLEWMDFNVNNHYTFNQVESLLSTEYSGWALATKAQVLELAHNAFWGVGYSSSEWEAKQGFLDAKYTTYNGSFDDIMSAMGIDYDVGASFHINGWFYTADGSLASMSIIDIKEPGERDEVKLSDSSSDIEWLKARRAFEWSTMLVKSDATPNQNIPEPSMLAIFGLGIMGFASRKFKKKS